MCGYGCRIDYSVSNIQVTVRPNPLASIFTFLFEQHTAICSYCWLIPEYLVWMSKFVQTQCVCGEVLCLSGAPATFSGQMCRLVDVLLPTCARVVSRFKNNRALMNSPFIWCKQATTLLTLPPSSLPYCMAWKWGCYSFGRETGLSNPSQGPIWVAAVH